MSSNNYSFTIQDEQLDWEQEGDGDGEGAIVLRSPDRRRTLLIAGEGALAGGLLGALVATAVVLSTATGSAAPKPPMHTVPVHHEPKAVVVAPQAPRRKAHHKVTRKHHEVTRKHHEVTHKRRKATHTKRSKPASTARIRSRANTHHDHRSSR